MKYLFSPQRSDDKIDYQLNGGVITTTLNGQTDTFDFSSLPDGQMDTVTTTLSVNPILKAERIDGVLEIILLNYIGANATEDERFPQWQEV